MDGRISMYVMLVCVWCSLDAGGLLMVVTAQPTASAVILTPEADRKEGGQVDMRCVATNLESDHIVAWTTENPRRFLSWGSTPYDTDPRFSFNTTENTTTVQNFTIIDVQRADSNEYFCSVRLKREGSGYDLVVQSSVTLSVLYFPNTSFPICFPAGPITVDNGTVLNMKCTSESGHRAVTMMFNATIHTARYTPWTSQVLDDTDTLFRTSDLTADVADEAIAFECIITEYMYYPNMERSCTIGPITIRDTMKIPATDPLCTSDSTTSTSGSSTNQGETESQSVTSRLPITDTQTFLPMTASPSPSTPWILAFAFSLVLAIALFIILILCIMGKNRLIKSLTAEKESKVPKTYPHIELQPTEDNGVYMEPTAATTTTEHTYYQPVEAEHDSPEYDYARPEGSNNTSYEAVRTPQSSADRQYQNINNYT